MATQLPPATAKSPLALMVFVEMVRPLRLSL